MSELELDYNEKCKEFIKDDTYLYKIQKPEEIKNIIQGLQNKVSTLDEQMQFVLSEYKKYYVFLHKNPDYADYQQMFSNAQSNLTKIGSDFFELSNEIDANTDLLNKKLTCLNTTIVKEKKQNTLLKQRLKRIEEKDNTSSELIYDYRQTYNEGYLRNWALFISIIITFISIKVLYSNVNGDMTSNVKNITNNLSNMGSNMYNNMRNMRNMGRK
jgi:hypothetical protein